VHEQHNGAFTQRYVVQRNPIILGLVMLYPVKHVIAHQNSPHTRRLLEKCFLHFSRARASARSRSEREIHVSVCQAAFSAA
jgi:hypothetical protein